MAEVKQTVKNGMKVISVNYNGVVREFVVPQGAFNTSNKTNTSSNSDLPPIANSECMISDDEDDDCCVVFENSDLNDSNNISKRAATKRHSTDKASEVAASKKCIESKMVKKNQSPLQPRINKSIAPATSNVQRSCTSTINNAIPVSGQVPSARVLSFAQSMPFSSQNLVQLQPHIQSVTTLRGASFANTVQSNSLPVLSTGAQTFCLGQPGTQFNLRMPVAGNGGQPIVIGQSPVLATPNGAPVEANNVRIATGLLANPSCIAPTNLSTNSKPVQPIIINSGYNNNQSIVIGSSVLNPLLTNTLNTGQNIINIGAMGSSQVSTSTVLSAASGASVINNKSSLADNTVVSGTPIASALNTLFSMNSQNLGLVIANLSSALNVNSLLSSVLPSVTSTGSVTSQSVIGSVMSSTASSKSNFISSNFPANAGNKQKHTKRGRPSKVKTNTLAIRSDVKTTTPSIPNKVKTTTPYRAIKPLLSSQIPAAVAAVQNGTIIDTDVENSSSVGQTIVIPDSTVTQSPTQDYAIPLYSVFHQNSNVNHSLQTSNPQIKSTGVGAIEEIVIEEETDASQSQMYDEQYLQPLSLTPPPVVESSSTTKQRNPVGLLQNFVSNVDKKTVTMPANHNVPQSVNPNSRLNIVPHCTNFNQILTSVPQQNNPNQPSTSVSQHNNPNQPSTSIPQSNNPNQPLTVKDHDGIERAIFGFTYLNNVRHAVIQGSMGFMALPLPETPVSRPVQILPKPTENNNASRNNCKESHNNMQLKSGIPLNVVTFPVTQSNTFNKGTTQNLNKETGISLNTVRSVAQNNTSKNETEQNLNQIKESSVLINVINSPDTQIQPKNKPVVMMHNLKVVEKSINVSNVYERFKDAVTCRGKQTLLKKLKVSYACGKLKIHEAGTLDRKIIGSCKEEERLRYFAPLSTLLESAYDEETDIEDVESESTEATSDKEDVTLTEAQDAPPVLKNCKDAAPNKPEQNQTDSPPNLHRFCGGTDCSECANEEQINVNDDCQKSAIKQIFDSTIQAYLAYPRNNTSTVEDFKLFQNIFQSVAKNRVILPKPN